MLQLLTSRIVNIPAPLAHDEPLGGEEPFFPHELWYPALWLFDPRRGELYPLYIGLGVLFGLVFVGAIVAHLLAPRLVRRHRLRLRLLRRLTTALAAISGLGLFWLACRAFALPLFSRPLWLWFTVIALVGVLVYALYYWRRRYPHEARAYEDVVRRRRWMPTPRKRVAARRR